MFEIGNFTPVWLIIIIMLITIPLIFYFAILSDLVETKMKSIGCVISSLTFFAVAFIVAGGFAIPVSTTSYDNPVFLTKEQADKFSHINNNKFEDKISKSIDADKASFEDISDEKMFQSFRNDEFVNFKALDGTSEISGSVYFTKTDMIVLVKNETDSGKEIKIPMK